MSDQEVQDESVNVREADQLPDNSEDTLVSLIKSQNLPEKRSQSQTDLSESKVLNPLWNNSLRVSKLDRQLTMTLPQ